MNLLKGEKIYLRAIEPEDVSFMYKWENDTNYWHLSNTQVPFSKNIMIQYANSEHDIYAQKQLRLIIVRKEDDAPIGAIDFFDFDPFHQRAGLGILIYNESNRNKGYASEAIQIANKYAKEALGLIQLYCNVLVSNSPSIQLFEKAGFTVSGKKIKWVKRGDVFEDELFLQHLF